MESPRRVVAQRRDQRGRGWCGFYIGSPHYLPYIFFLPSGHNTARYCYQASILCCCRVAIGRSLSTHRTIDLMIGWDAFRIWAVLLTVILSQCRLYELTVNRDVDCCKTPYRDSTSPTKRNHKTGTSCYPKSI